MHHTVSASDCLESASGESGVEAITATDGKNYNTKHYNLKAIIAVGYKVNSERAVQFRKWATDIVSEYTSKAMFYGAKKRYHLALFSQGSLLKTLLLKA